MWRPAVTEDGGLNALNASSTVNHGNNRRITALIQARMSSSRFPGKVLALLWGEPIIQHVLRAVEATPGIRTVAVATSDQASDDPLVEFLQAADVAVVRGPLDNVLRRYQLGAQAYPADWVLRICADSPCVDTKILKAVASHCHRSDVDLVTTRYPASFPKGQNAELIRTERLLELNSDELTAEECEHVTPYFYHHADRYGIVRIQPSQSDLKLRSLVVDTPVDLARLEQMSKNDLPVYDAAGMGWTFHPPRAGTVDARGATTGRAQSPASQPKSAEAPSHR